MGGKKKVSTKTIEEVKVWADCQGNGRDRQAKSKEKGKKLKKNNQGRIRNGKRAYRCHYPEKLDSG